MAPSDPNPPAPATALPETVANILALGVDFHAQDQRDNAAACFFKVLEFYPGNAVALRHLGVLAYQAMDYGRSIELLEEAARRDPTAAATYVNLGAAYRKAARDTDARAAFETAIGLQPRLAEAYFNLGRVLTDLRDFDAAKAAYQTCIALDPGDVDALVNLGNLQKRDAPDAAMETYRRAQAADPNHALAYANMAAMLLDRGDMDGALALLDKAIALDPRPGDLRYRRGLKLLARGQLAVGWADYESRYYRESVRTPRHVPPPATWTGDDLTGKTILVWMEQGIGDEIMFASMIPDVLARAGRCVVECAPRMVPVFARSFPQAIVGAFRDPPSPIQPAEAIDTQISAASLGQFLRRDFAAFPGHAGYLTADPARSAQLRARYGAHAPGNLLVGISWRSKFDTAGNTKTTSLDQWKDILTVPGVTFVSLQYGDCAGEVAQVQEHLGVRIIHDTEIDALADMDGFFAQTAAMDLVISTSNTAAHVAGSLGMPALVVLSAGPNWYWFASRTDSPWYPSLTLLRDSPAPDVPAWRAPLAQAAALLRERAAKSNPRE